MKLRKFWSISGGCAPGAPPWICHCIGLQRRISIQKIGYVTNDKLHISKEKLLNVIAAYQICNIYFMRIFENKKFAYIEEKSTYVYFVVTFVHHCNGVFTLASPEPEQG